MKRIVRIALSLGAIMALGFVGCTVNVETSGGSGNSTSGSSVLTFSGTDYTALPAGTDGTLETGGTYVNFGDWPQTIKADSVTVDETKSVVVGAYTYYKGSDGAWYAKIKENAYNSGYKYSDGTDVAQDSANSYKYFKVEPIKWRKLTDDYSGKRLLLAENILVNHRYAVGSNNYANSEIRTYLNDTFWNTAFTASAKSKI
ncbi:MAG: hypothetical protein II716_07160, partial [Treponema sp.]|nr:hypothetical protein [Treponema sp.]